MMKQNLILHYLDDIVLNLFSSSLLIYSKASLVRELAESFVLNKGTTEQQFSPGV